MNPGSLGVEQLHQVDLGIRWPSPQFARIGAQCRLVHAKRLDRRVPLHTDEPHQ